MKAGIPLLLFAAIGSSDAANSVQKTKGAIGDVISLLQEMLDKSEEDGEAAREAYAKFKCYCDKNKKEKREDIEENAETVTLLENKIGKLQGLNGELSVEVAALAKDIEANEAKREEAETIRTKQNEAFVAEELDLTAAAEQMEEAIQTLGEIGADNEESLLAKKAPQLKKWSPKLGKTVQQALIAANTFLTPAQKKITTNFLQQKAPFTGTYTTQSGAVVGILKSMKDTFEANIKTAQETEAKQLEAHEKLMETLNDAYDKMKSTYDDKQGELGDNDGDLSTKKEQYDEAKTIVEEATEFLDKLLPMCDRKEKQYNVRKILRAGEETAIAKAISILNTEKATGAEDLEDKKKFFLQTGKKAPKTFLQLASVRSNALSTKAAVEKVLRQANSLHKSKRLTRVLALLDAGNPFVTVIQQIERTIKLIAEEQKLDEEQKEWCISEREENQEELDNKNSDITSLEGDIDDLDEKIDDPTTGLKQQIKDTEEDIEENHQSQIDETDARRDENLAYQKDVKTMTDAQEALQKAIDVLSTYYKSLEEHNDDGDDEFLQMKKHGHKKEDPDAPDAGMDDDYEGQSEKGNEVLDTLKDIKSNTHDQETRCHEDEEEAQHDYEDSMASLKEGEAELRETLANLEKDLADSKETLDAKHDELKSTKKEKMKIEQYLDKIKDGCDFVVDNFDDRESNREAEKEALEKAIELLEGSPVFQAAATEEDHRRMGKCKDTCTDDESHVDCKACLKGVSVPGYCAGHADTPGC